MSLLNAHLERASSTTSQPGDVGRPDRTHIQRSQGQSGPIQLGASHAASHAESRLLNILDRIGCGYIAVEKQKRVLEANATARQILLQEEDAVDTADGLTSAFKRLVSRAQTPFAPGRLSWVAVSGNGDPPIIFNRAADTSPDGVSSIILIDLNAHLEPNPLALQLMFGLTTAETRLALQLARGDSPAAIARNRSLSRTTVRSQLASIFSKTQTRRQSDLVLLLARVAVLP